MRGWVLAGFAVLLLVTVAFMYRPRDAADAQAVPVAPGAANPGAPAGLAPTPRNIPALAAQLRSADPAQAIAAASTLGYTRSPDAVAPLMAAITDNRPQVQVAAADSLARLQPEADPAPIIHLVETSADPTVRAAGLNYLAVHKVEAACPLMLKYLEDPDADVRGRAYAGIAGLVEGRNYHFNANDPPEKRQAVIAKIRATVVPRNNRGTSQ